MKTDGYKSKEIELIIRTSDRSFEASFRFPVTASKEQIDYFAKLWIEGLRGAIKSQTEKT